MKLRLHARVFGPAAVLRCVLPLARTAPRVERHRSVLLACQSLPGLHLIPARCSLHPPLFIAPSACACRYDCVWSEENENILVSASGDGSIKVCPLCFSLQ